MSRVVLNSTVGKITIEGDVDVDKVIQEAKKENYRIIAEGTASPLQEAESRHVDWELVRAIASGTALLVAFLMQRLRTPEGLFLLLYIVAIVSGGWDNARKAWYSIPKFDFNMSVLMTTAIIGALAIGKWEEGATVAFLYSISELLEVWSMEKARQSIRDLMDIAPKIARVRRPIGEYNLSVEMEISVYEIEVNDIVIIRPGEKITMDGTILKGESAVNEAAITGEFLPKDKEPGAEVYAGTLNTTGSLEIEVTKRVEDTTIAKIIHLVEEAQTKRAPSQAFVDRFAAIYTPIVLALAVGIVFLPPLVMGYPWEPWIYRGLALLVVSCPCALVVSTPMAIVSAISSAARQGVLIKGGIFLEQAGSIKAIAFDKTGTLTKGHPAVLDVIPLGEMTEKELLQIAASLEARSEHPLAKSIVQAAQEHFISVEAAEDVTALTGRGVKGTLSGEIYYIGNNRLFEEMGLPVESGGYRNGRSGYRHRHGDCRYHIDGG